MTDLGEPGSWREGEGVHAVEILDYATGNVEQTVGPFRDASEAEDWIEDQFGKFPSDEARVTRKPLPSDAINPNG
jgi:hypothetical protein